MNDDKQAAFNAALARAIEKAKAVSKDATNTYSDYKYASAEAIIEEARGPLAAEGFALIPKRWTVRHLVGGPVSTGGRAGMYFADIDVLYKVTHKDGWFEECEATTPACTDNGRPQDKAVATALTYSLGYFLRALLQLPRVDAEHDVDQRDDRPNPGRDDRKRQPVTPAKPDYDVEYVIKAIQAAKDDDTMQMIANDIADNAPAAAKPRLRAEWGKQKKALLEGKAAA